MNHNDSASILIAGDLVAFRTNELLLAAGKAETVFGDILPIAESCDSFIANLEVPLTDFSRPSPKWGPALKASPEVIAGLCRAGFDIFGLANNHIMDYGPSGLESTVKCCRENGIRFVGAGNNLVESENYEMINKGGVSIGITAVAEREFSYADRDYPGTAPADIIRVKHTIDRMAKQCDHIVVLYHGGNEKYEYPSPDLQEKCRFLIECGVDCVLCQHSHIIGCYEYYRDGFILYGQGNFLFPYGIDALFWRTGLLVKIVFTARERKKVELLPIIQPLGEPGVRLANPELTATIVSDLKKRSAALGKPDFLHKEWRKYCLSSRKQYLENFLGIPWRLRKFNKNGILFRFYSAYKLRSIGNLLRCDAHRNVMFELFQADIDKEWKRSCK